MDETNKLRRGFWNGKYADRHTPWDLGRESEPVRRLAASHFPSAGRVLIPGCGRGYEAVYLAERGYRVTAVDFADEAVRFLRELAGEKGVILEILQEDLFSLDAARNGTFDVLLEQTCFCAIDPSLYRDYEQMAHRLLAPGGRLLGVFMEVKDIEGPPYDCPLDMVRGQFPEDRWRFDWSEPLPRNPERPGPEYLAAFTKRGD